VGGKILSSVSNRSSNKKPEGNKSQGKDIESFKSTISCDKKEKKESKECTGECKEIDREESKRILELKKTTKAWRAMIKKGQHNKVILMGMGMQINNNSSRSSTKKESSVSCNRIATNYGRSSTKEESLVANDKIITSSGMSSTRKKSTQTGSYFDSIIKYTLNKSDILKRDTSVHISINTVRNKWVKPGSKFFKMIQSFQGSHASTSMAAHKISCNMQLQSRNIDLLSINRNWQPTLKSFEDSKAMGEYMLPMFLTFGNLISGFISLVSNS
jgi:hypothetical protein